MENLIITRSLKRQLDQVVLHEQVKNGDTINNNLNAYQFDQQFVTPKRVFHIKQRDLWTKERATSHKTPQTSPIIPREVQISETQRCTNSLQQNSKRI